MVADILLATNGLKLREQKPSSSFRLNPSTRIKRKKKKNKQSQYDASRSGSVGKPACKYLNSNGNTEE